MSFYWIRSVAIAAAVRLLNEPQFWRHVGGLFIELLATRPADRALGGATQSEPYNAAFASSARSALPGPVLMPVRGWAPALRRECQAFDF